MQEYPQTDDCSFAIHDPGGQRVTAKQLRKRAKAVESAEKCAKAQAKAERKRKKKNARDKAAARAAIVEITTDSNAQPFERIAAARTILYGENA